LEFSRPSNEDRQVFPFLFVFKYDPISIKNL
jgi:hypothetical protein